MNKDRIRLRLRRMKQNRIADSRTRFVTCPSDLMLHRFLGWIFGHFNVSRLDGAVLLIATIGPAHHLRCNTRSAATNVETRCTVAGVVATVARENAHAHACQNKHQDKHGVEETDIDENIHVTVRNRGTVGHDWIHGVHGFNIENAANQIDDPDHKNKDSDFLPAQAQGCNDGREAIR